MDRRPIFAAWRKAMMRVLPATGNAVLEASLSRIAADVDGLFGQLLVSPSPHQSPLYDAMRYAALSGGKRLRPLLVTATAELFDVPRSWALRAGIAAECIHTHSLIHDDLPCMDDDDLRRGRPTVHRVFGEANALLAGDALHASAFQILAEPATHPDPQIRMELAASLARSIGGEGMAGGQMLDLLQPTGEAHNFSAVKQLQELKTGKLFVWCAEAAARLGRAPPYDRISVIAYACCVGLAFQITDDLIDHTGRELDAGKRVRKDEAQGKVTFVQLLGIEGARRKVSALLSEAIQHVEGFGARAELLVQLAGFVGHRNR
jgi:farnesyl diphosphate synthase